MQPSALARLTHFHIRVKLTESYFLHEDDIITSLVIFSYLYACVAYTFQLYSKVVQLLQLTFARRLSKLRHVCKREIEYHLLRVCSSSEDGASRHTIHHIRASALPQAGNAFSRG
jgi:hypothetical protein